MSLHAFEVKCLSFIKFYEKGWEEGSVWRWWARDDDEYHWWTEHNSAQEQKTKYECIKTVVRKTKPWTQGHDDEYYNEQKQSHANKIMMMNTMVNRKQSTQARDDYASFFCTNNCR
jgi:hypothetical protein